MFGVFYVDEIDDDDVIQIVQVQLLVDGVGGFKIGFEDGFFQIVMFDKVVGVDVDGGYCFSLVDDDVIIGFELYFVVEGFLDFVFD